MPEKSPQPRVTALWTKSGRHIVSITECLFHFTNNTIQLLQEKCVISCKGRYYLIGHQDTAI